MTYSCAIFPELDGDLHPPLSSSSSPTPSRTGASTPSTLAGSDDAPKTIQFDALALFPAPSAESEPPSGPDALEAAQFRKLRHILRKADIRPGHRVRPPPLSLSPPLTRSELTRAKQVLEIGSGWGALSILVTSTIPGTTVDTLTLSTQQAALANARAQAAGVADRVRVHLLDYRDMPPEWEGAFDRVVSVEMVEAVGREYMEVRASCSRV